LPVDEALPLFALLLLALAAGAETGCASARSAPA
jgi:hypothetical protein